MINKAVYRISAAGYCPRRLGAIHLGYPVTAPSYSLMAAAEEGRWHEDRIRNELIAEGLVIEHEGECQLQGCEGKEGVHVEGFLGNNVMLIGHMDGLILDDTSSRYLPSGKRAVLEVKSMSEYEFARWRKERWAGFPAYADQLTCYMHLEECDKALYVVKNRNNGLKDIFVQDGTPSNYQVIRERIETVAADVQKNRLLDAEYNYDSIECRRCEFKSLCLIEGTVKLDEEKAVFYSHQWRYAKQMEQDAQNMKEEAEHYLKGHVLANSNDSTQPYKYEVNGLVIAGFPTRESAVSYIKEAGYQCRITDTSSSGSPAGTNKREKNQSASS